MYKFTPLRKDTKHIRLLRLHSSPLAGIIPPVSFDDLKPEIVSTPLQQAPAYICVSYAWITDVRDVPLYLNDGSVILITPSLCEALPYLARDQPGYLWIDKVCMNQDDDVERTEQVSIMRDIFASAIAVNVWLSTET